jgi:hypothetical protein
VSKTFLIIFHGQIVNGKIIDIGDDPCFDNPPTWGICRPTTRRAIKEEDTLIFIAKVDTDYFLKGWFQVAEKLDYPSALKRFPNRQNVIISMTPSQHIIEWRYKNLEKSYIKTHGPATPNFLMSLNTSHGTFYQSKTDGHETDNWKCRRILLCRSKQFEECILANTCFKNGVSLTKVEYKNYVVADVEHCEDLDHLRITLDEIVKATNFPTNIRTPKNQHNVLRFDNYKQKFLELVATKTLKNKSGN